MKIMHLAAVFMSVGISGAADATEGQTLFLQNCAMCHQSAATGLPGMFPRLAGRIAAISSSAEGRSYLIDVLTYGLAGTITVDGQAITGAMPAFAQISDADVASILSYLQTVGTAPPKPPAGLTEAEVKARRAKTAAAVKTSDDVKTERESLEKSKLLE